jgi:hypothetical protein
MVANPPLDLALGLRSPRRAEVDVETGSLCEPLIRRVVLTPGTGSPHHRRLLVVDPDAGGNAAQPFQRGDVHFLPGQLIFAQRPNQSGEARPGQLKMEAQQIHRSPGHHDLREESPVPLALGTCRRFHSPPGP